jgi:hypothetical protein
MHQKPMLEMDAFLLAYVVPMSDRTLELSGNAGAEATACRLPMLVPT